MTLHEAKEILRQMTLQWDDRGEHFSLPPQERMAIRLVLANTVVTMEELPDIEDLREELRDLRSR